MTILACDQSFTHCGYVVIDDYNIIREFNIIVSDARKSIYDRALDIATALTTVTMFNAPSEIRLEGLAFGMRGNATRDLAGLLFTIVTTLKQKCNFHNIEIISPKQVKKKATGSGKATKKDMIDALPPDVRDLFKSKNYRLTTGLADLADAYWLSQC